ncbi:MAG: hypothetical protein ACREXX_08870 [Gammaproteobacteria bacterium]
MVGGGSSVGLGGGFQWLSASLPCESRCGDRQEQGFVYDGANWVQVGGALAWA